MKRFMRALSGALALLCAGSAAIVAQPTTTINGLPAASQPVACNELLPIWQAGRMVKLPLTAGGAVCQGSSPPASPVQYQEWWDTSSSPTTAKRYDGSQWVVTGTLNPTTHVWAPVGGVAANPTATIGASAVNGSATTYMRSDAAPALPATLPALNGSNLTSLNGSNIASGTVPTGRLPAGKSVAAANGVLESLLPIQTVSGTSKTFATADLQMETRRSNGGIAMTDAFPAAAAAGMVNGARITLNNFDATATNTVTAGSGTAFSAGSTFVVPPSRSIAFVYDQPATTWRATMNTSTAVVGPASAVANDLAVFGDVTGKVIADAGVALADIITANTTSGVTPGTYGSSSRCPVGITVAANGLVTAIGDSTSCPGGGGGGGAGIDFFGTFSHSGNNFSASASGFTLTDGYRVRGIPDASSTAAPFLNVQSSGSLPIYRQTAGSGFIAAGGGDVISGIIQDFTYNASLAGGAWVVTSVAPSGSFTVAVNTTVNIPAFTNGACLYKVTAAGKTITFPASTSLGNGGACYVWAYGADTTLASSGGDSINITTVKNGQIALVTSDGIGALSVQLSGVPNGAGVLYHDSSSTIANSGTLTANGGVYGGGANAAPGSTSGLTDGQLMVGSSTGVPTAANLTAGTGVSIANGHNTVTISASAGVPAVIYAANKWYWAGAGVGIAGVGVMGTGIIHWWPVDIYRSVDISNIGDLVTTAAAGGNCQFALYATDSSGLMTGSALATTGDVSVASATSVNGAVNSGTPYTVSTPGRYMFGGNCDNATVKLQAFSTGNVGANTGSDTQGHLGATATGNQTAFQTTQTYGTWPTNPTISSYSSTAFWAAQFEVSAVH